MAFENLVQRICFSKKRSLALSCSAVEILMLCILVHFQVCIKDRRSDADNMGMSFAFLLNMVAGQHFILLHCNLDLLEV